LFTTGAIPSLPIIGRPTVNDLAMYKVRKMKKLRFVGPTREALGRLTDYLVSLKVRGHGGWMIGQMMDDADGRVHMDVVSFQEDPMFSIQNLWNYIPDGVTGDEVPLDVRPSDPITTGRLAEATLSHKLTSLVLKGDDPKSLVEALIDEAKKKITIGELV